MTRIVITRLPLISYAVRVHADESDAWETGFVVSRPWWSLRLIVGLLMGNPRLPWRKLAAEHFPDAPSVTFDRLSGGAMRSITLKLCPRPYWRRAIAMLLPGRPTGSEERIIGAINEGFGIMSEALDRLRAEVTEMGDAVQAAKLSITGMAQIIRDNIDNREALEDLADSLDAQANDLLQSVVDNTPTDMPAA